MGNSSAYHYYLAAEVVRADKYLFDPVRVDEPCPHPPSRPPSPVHSPAPSTASDARVIYDLLNTLPKPTPTDDASRDAREAVDEAFESLAALSALLGAVDSSS